MIDLARAIQHPFEDKDWAVKMLVGAGVSLVPILNFAVNGYGLQAQRNTAARQDVPLPRWDDLGKYMIDGLKLCIVQLIYMLPIMVIGFGLMFLSIAFGVGMDSVRSNARDAFGIGFSVIVLALICLIMLYGLAYACIMPATYIQLARTGQISSAFNFKEIMALIKARSGDYAVVVIAPLIFSMGFGVVFMVLAIIPLVGICVSFLMVPIILVTIPYFVLMFSHLYGQLMRP